MKLTVQFKNKNCRFVLYFVSLTYKVKLLHPSTKRVAAAIKMSKKNKAHSKNGTLKKQKTL